MRRVTILLRPEHEQMVAYLKQKWGAVGLTDVLLRAIAFAHEELQVPGYVAARLGTVKLTPMERAKAKVEAEEAIAAEKARVKNEKQLELAKELEGEIVDINGIPHCRYNQYTEMGGKKVDIGVMTEPLEDLNQDSVLFQYRDIMGNTGPEAKKKLLGLMSK